MNVSEMTACDAVSIIKLLEHNGMEVHVDGGWGVDALLGKQTRRHEDLDIALSHKYVSQLRVLLAARGYEEVPRPDSWECNFVLGDDKGHLIDIHSYAGGIQAKIKLLELEGVDMSKLFVPKRGTAL